MGKRRRYNKKQQNKNEWKQSKTSGDHQGGYTEVKMENPAFEGYYKEQKLVKEEEWNDFMSILKTNLPSVFRITGFRGQSNQVLRYLKSECFSELLNSTSEEALETRPFPIPWYPNDLAWQLNLTRKNIRKLPALEKLHLFLISETESGNISRQEIVSMIPPLLMQVKPHHRVLDMCAAPGSKTAQLIEMVHAEQTLGWPEGFVIGNDDDNRRCYIMVHQAKRLNSPCCMVVNHDASVFPRLRVPSPDGQLVNLEYDRILCDVPCGGDGTLRKNYAIWKKWTPLSGFNLHPLQRRILLRGTELLAVGGRLVYSTCSFNPIENEAVVADVLRQSQGAVELVDVSDELPGLKRIQGMLTWKVIDDKGQIFTSMEDVAEREEKDKRRRYKPSFWPPSEEEAQALNLQRCVRILPHHQDTGGFFVAVLRKTKPLPWMKQDKSAAQGVTEEKKPDADMRDDSNETAEKASQGEDAVAVAAKASAGDASKSAPEPPTKKARFGSYKEDPFVFLKEGEEIWPQIKEFYDVQDSFPMTQVLTRCHVGKKRNLYLTNRLIKSILQHNEERLKVINSGVKILSRSSSDDVPCDFRLTQDGINILYPYVKRRKLTVKREDIVTLFSEENPFTKNFSEGIKETLDTMGQGSVILTYQPENEVDGKPESPFIIVGWRGKTSLRSYVAKGDRQHILRLVGGPVSVSKNPRTSSAAESSAHTPQATAEDNGEKLDGDAVGDDEERGNIEEEKDDEEEEEKEEAEGARVESEMQEEPMEEADEACRTEDSPAE
ncbi:RNA cytosine-C(5)-methyltransferase NSUN2-like [Diadema antillarum]|uniref:RNA cytosine-C(5)-methyltransferase NSUN2-like n=1 Tax=Diadema antillarum TaxID=105358 RepID=UPI003A83D7C0